MHRILDVLRLHTSKSLFEIEADDKEPYSSLI